MSFDIPADDFSDIMSLEHFIGTAKCGAFIPSDGCGWIAQMQLVRNLVLIQQRINMRLLSDGITPAHPLWKKLGGSL